MIVLDTNVLSELIRREPAPAVVEWVAGQSASSLFTTFVTEAEMRYGVALLPESSRKDALEAALNGMFAEDFTGRVLAFDGAAARAYAVLAALRWRLGRPISQFDALIAATARSKRASIATRNVADFEHCGVGVIDPWDG